MTDPVRFPMILRDRKVEVVAELLEFNPPEKIKFNITIYDLSGKPLDWELERAELAAVARKAAEASW